MRFNPDTESKARFIDDLAAETLAAWNLSQAKKKTAKEAAVKSLDRVFEESAPRVRLSEAQVNVMLCQSYKNTANIVGGRLDTVSSDEGFNRNLHQLMNHRSHQPPF